MSSAIGAYWDGRNFYWFLLKKPPNASKDFFTEFNKPWLEKAINRGDDVILATRPVSKAELITKTGELKGMYAREVKFLVDKNYKPINISPEEWKTIKTWF